MSRAPELVRTHPKPSTGTRSRGLIGGGGVRRGALGVDNDVMVGFAQPESSQGHLSRPGRNRVSRPPRSTAPAPLRAGVYRTYEVLRKSPTPNGYSDGYRIGLTYSTDHRRALPWPSTLPDQLTISLVRHTTDCAERLECRDRAHQLAPSRTA